MDVGALTRDLADPRRSLFPAQHESGIPDLDLARQPVSIPTPIIGWGTLSRTRTHSGTYHCYVDDYRMSAMLRSPGDLVNTGCAVAVEPNISLYDDTPLALCAARLYHSRWTARYWQSRGIDVLVDLGVPERVIDSGLWRVGIPAGWKAFATRAYDRRLEDLSREYATAKEVAGTQPLLLVIGGGRATAEWCGDHPGVIHAGYARTKNLHGRDS